MQNKCNLHVGVSWNFYGFILRVFLRAKVPLHNKKKFHEVPRGKMRIEQYQCVKRWWNVWNSHGTIEKFHQVIDGTSGTSPFREVPRFHDLNFGSSCNV